MATLFSLGESWNRSKDILLFGKINCNLIIEAVVLIISAVCTICIMGWVLWCVRFGIDFADEGFYLNWISNPFKYSASITQFGYIYHLFFKFVDGDIAALRQLNILITFLLAWILCFVYLSNVFGYKTIRLVSQFVISAAIATSSLCFLRLWLPTPSYNWLAFQSLLISAIGMLLAKNSFMRFSVAGWMLIGLGGWLAFMAKPSTAACLVLFLLLYILSSKKTNIYLIGLSLATATLMTLVFVLLVDNSIVGFYNRLVEGLKYAHLLSPDRSAGAIFRFDRFNFNINELYYFVCGCAGVITLHFFSRSRSVVVRFIWMVLLCGIVLFILSIVFGYTIEVFPDGQWVQLVVLAVPATYLLICILEKTLGSSNTIRARSRWPIFLILLILPYAFAFGTGNNYWSFYGLVSLFFILAGLSFLDKKCADEQAFPLLSLSIVVQFFSVSIVLLGVQGPYAQPNPVSKSDYKIDIGERGSALIIPETFGRYISDAIKVSREAGFVDGTPVIDLTGHSPGVLYALRASSPGVPWIYGNFVNSRNAEDFAREVLKKIECEESSRAWLLLERDGPVNISADVLKIIGADVSSDFETVGVFSTAPYVGGFAKVQIQQFFKPTRSYTDAVAACKVAKKVSNSN